MFLRIPTIRKSRIIRGRALESHAIDHLDFRCALIVEESISLRAMLVEFLKKRGWIAHGIQRLDQALPLLKSVPYHFIVVDTAPSCASALSFARMLGGSEEWVRIPLVLISDPTTELSLIGRDIANFEVADRSAWPSDLTDILLRLEPRGRWKRQVYAS